MSATKTTVPTAGSAQTHGDVALDLDRAGAAVLSKLYSSYPLKLLPITCSNNPRIVSLYSMGHGGGLLSEDVVNIQVRLTGGSILVLKTQGTTKVFKAGLNLNPSLSRKKVSTQTMHCHVADDSFLLSVPDPTTCFSSSSLRQKLSCQLSSAASCLIVDAYTCGRESQGEIWQASKIHSTVQLTIDNKLVLLENLDLEATTFGTLGQKIGARPPPSVFGSIILAGPQTLRLRLLLQSLKQRQSFRNHKSAAQLQATQQEQQEKDPLVSVCDLPCKSATILRFSCETVEDAFCLLAAIIKPLADELQLSPCPYADKIDPSALAARSARSGSLFEKLAHVDTDIVDTEVGSGSKRKAEE